MTLVTLLMMRVCVFAVNARKLSLEDLCSNGVYVYVVVSEFHTSDNKNNPSTMHPDKRNMSLETIALLFLAL